MGYATTFEAMEGLDTFVRAVPRVREALRARDSMTEGARGGLRPLERGAIERWRRPEHRPRLREILRRLPDLPRCLIERGYERDESWLAELEASDDP